ncbi:uncharacterized protein [Diadema antillarum]|uniref:uncharacterized protein n=1 Tax=Diadema antillarum TaxID=105358 RepID=UPI003A8A7241
MADSRQQPVRVMLWSLPRSCTTVFTRCMESLGSALGGGEIFWEPFVSCEFYGPDRRHFFANDSPQLLNDKYTYAYVRDLMEQDFPQGKLVFGKDVTIGIMGKFEYIPKNYRHSFLIRDPRKVFPSIQRLSDAVPEAHRFSVNKEYGNGYRELVELSRHIESTFGQKPVIIDADELLAEPERIMPMYCRAVGLQYDPKMLEWGQVDVTQLRWHCAETMAGYEDMGIFTNALKNTRFNPHLSKKSFDETEWTPEIRECIDAAMPIYQELYKSRLQN